MNAARLINQTSGEVEYYTPAPIIESARRAMGSITLDPASSRAANITVKAASIFTKADDGLSRPWSGNVWLNHPFGRGLNQKWITKLVSEYGGMGAVEQACCITYACTSEAWFKPLLLRPQCFLIPRTNYLLPDGTVYRGVTKGSVVTYFGHNWQAFVREFKHLGVVKDCI